MSDDKLDTLHSFLSENSPSILTGLAIMGVPTMIYATVRGTTAARALLDREEQQRMTSWEETQDNKFLEPLTKLEVVKICWKCYIPAGLIGLATIGAMVGANSINLQRNAALASLYSFAEKAAIEYQTKIIEQIGEKREREIREDMYQDRLDKHPVQNVIFTGTGKSLFFDSYSGRYFESDFETIRRIQNEYNARLMSEMYLTVNELYWMLGLESNAMGEHNGWDIEMGLLEFDFSTKLTPPPDRRPCVVLDYKIKPVNMK